MGCFPFANFHFQMGVIVMGFAEDSGPNVVLGRKYCTIVHNVLKFCQKNADWVNQAQLWTFLTYDIHHMKQTRGRAKKGHRHFTSYLKNY